MRGVVNPPAFTMVIYPVKSTNYMKFICSVQIKSLESLDYSL